MSTSNLADCQASLLPKARPKPMAEAQGVHAMLNTRVNIRCTSKGQIHANILALSELFYCRETRHLIGCQIRVDSNKPRRGVKLPALQIAWETSDWQSLGREDERILKSRINDFGFGPFRIGLLRGAMAIYALDVQKAQAMRDLAAVLAAPDALERVGFEVWDRVRPSAGSCMRSVTRLIRYAGQTRAVPLDGLQRQGAVACIKRVGWAGLTDADIGQSLRSATVREVVQPKSYTKGAAR